MAKKTKAFSEISKLKNQIDGIAREIEGYYTQIGKNYCESHQGVPEECVKEQVMAVAEAGKRIKELEEKIQEIKNRDFCPKCGAKIPEGYLYCYQCGERLPDRGARVGIPELVNCPKCGKNMPKGQKFCSECGTELPKDGEEKKVKTCPGCGMEVEASMKFCSNCGRNLQEKSEAVD